MSLFLNKITSNLRFVFRQRLYISSDIINTSVKNFHYSVNENDVAAYNDSVKFDNQSIINKQNIHPLFYTKISWRIIQNLNKYLESPINDKILKTIVHQSEYITFHNELKLPSELKVESKIWSIQAHKKGTKMLIRFDYYSENKLIATEYSGGILFGVKCLGEAKTMGNLPKTERINKVAIWKESIEINKLLPYIYAEKAEIDAPIHTNPIYAKSIGLPDIILQGTCSFAKSLNLILSREFQNQSVKLKSVSAKFTGILIPPNLLTVRLLEKEENLFRFDVLNNDGKAVIKGGEILFY